MSLIDVENIVDAVVGANVAIAVIFWLWPWSQQFDKNVADAKKISWKDLEACEDLGGPGDITNY